MRNQRMQELKGAERKAAKPLLYIAMVSIVMLFFGAYQCLYSACR